MSESNILRIKSEKGNMYIFDALSNNIYQIEDEEDFNSITLNDLGHRNTRRVEADTSSDVHSAVSNHAKTLVIELTEKCNLRCTYCVFDEDSELDRNHTNKSIDLKKALKSINSFYKRTSNGIAYIVFYGGEPLLAFENIVKLVHHANKISNNKVKFSFTTNGTLLTKEKFDFLVSNDFLITVSLDGNKKIHDITRVTRKGNGTFDIIMSNLNELKEYNESYYNKKIQFNCVLSEIKHISPNNEYVLSNNLNSFRFSPEIQNQHSINTHIISEITKGANKKNILDKLDSKPIQKSYIENVVKKIEFRELDSNAHKGKKKCIPFSNRTYIRTDGTVQFCERIGSFSQTHSDSELVDLSNSIIEDFNQMKSEDCSHCFAYNFCEMCPATFIVNGKFNSMVSNSKCSGYRELVKSALLIYINKEEDNSE